MLFEQIRPKKIDALVENKTVYEAEFASLYIYETFKKAENIYLQFNFPIIASMLQGKKHMYVGNAPGFDFLPGETVTLPSQEKMIIDFPDAQFNSPTRCLALGIDAEKIKKTTDHYKELIDIQNDIKLPVQTELQPEHILNNDHLQHLVNKLMMTFVDDNKAKDALLDVMINELIIRLLQTKARHILLSEGKMDINKNRLAFIASFIEDNFTENLSVAYLADKAYMSPSQFYKKFKLTFGETPVNFLNNKRIEFAKKLLKDTPTKITTISQSCGFNSACYFNRIFKSKVGMTPNQFRKNYALA
jgi:AraC-like DNA-binding protein